MNNLAAVRAAIDLYQVPSRVAHIRKAPLPADIPVLLKIASGDETALADAAQNTSRDAALVKSAAYFFIEQILMAPESDPYRVLGADPDDELTDIRKNMALLMLWLHPDMNNSSQRDRFAHRVNEAWDNLKTEERRSAYDLEIALRETFPKPQPLQTAKTSNGLARGPIQRPPSRGTPLQRFPHLARVPNESLWSRLVRWLQG